MRAWQHGLWLLLLQGGCGWKRSGEVTPLELSLQEIDVLHQQRIDEAHLRESIRLAESLEIEYPHEPRVQWRLSRGLSALAYGHEPENAEELLMQAIGWGRECLRANPGWAARESLSGGQVARRAAQRLVQSDLPCLEALLEGWTRWVVQRGPAAHIDLTSLELLAGRALELDQADPGWIGPWALGMAVGLSVSAGDRMSEALAHLEVATAREEELATPRIDSMYLLMMKGDSSSVEIDVSTGHPTHSTHAWSLENRRAVQREIQMRDRGQSGAF